MSTSEGQPNLMLCFDGSANAEHAIATAGRLCPGSRAAVVHVWKDGFPSPAAVYGPAVVLPPEVAEDVRRKAAEHAAQLADTGARLAERAGLVAEAQAVEVDGAVWRELLRMADALDASVIVAGSRGFGEIKAFLLGSTSAALAHHSTRPVLIVPPADQQAAAR